MTPTQLHTTRTIPVGSMVYLRARIVDRNSGFDDKGVAVALVDKLGRPGDAVYYVKESDLISVSDARKAVTG